MNHASTFSTVSAEKLKAALANIGAPVLIDTLPGDHFAAAHLPGAVNACVYEVTFPQQIEAIVRDLDAPVVLYGAGPGSMDAVVAAEKMLRMGYRYVTVFEGGITAWTAANYEITGNLTLRGISRTLRFPATVNRLPDGGFAAEAHFDIDRTRWGIIYGSARFFKHLDMHKVYDVISFEVRLVFQD